jgi:hypothetical protein
MANGNVQIHCPTCNARFEPDFLKVQGIHPCPGCSRPIRLDLYPVLFQSRANGSAGEAVAMEDEASCYYHPKKRAEIACEACGRFLCGLCDMEFNGRHLCPACMEVGQEKGKIRDLQNHRTLYDRLALAVAVLPIVTIWLTLFSAPLAVFLAIRYWRAPGSLVRRSRVRFILAFLIACIQIAAWGVGGYALIKQLS